MKRTCRRPVVLACTLLLVPGVLAGCAHRAPHGAETGGDPVPVAVVAPTLTRPTADVRLTGRVRARQEVTLDARLAARLTDLPLREGARFRAGAPLARFESPEIRDALASSAAALEAARVRRDLARRQQARYDSLYAGGLVSVRDLELVTSEREAAEAAWTAARAAAAEVNERAVLTAPFDGVVARRHVDVGQVLQPGDPVLDLRSLGPVEIEVALPETSVPGIERARAGFQTGDGPWRPMTLVRLDGAVDPATRTRLATFRPDGRGVALEPGAWARVRLEHAAGGPAAAGGLSAALSVPRSSVVERGGLRGVFVVRDGRAWLRWVRTGHAADGRVEVLAGLSPGEPVALAPEGLADGLPVRITR